MKTLNPSTFRCAGRLDLAHNDIDLYPASWCPERLTCARYLALIDWDKKNGIENYQGIEVLMAVKDCRNKIEVKDAT